VYNLTPYQILFARVLHTVRYQLM